MQTKGVIYPVIYYRVALQSEQSSSWQWRSCTLTSVSSVFEILETYTYVPKTSIRVFLSSSSAYLDEMLTYENDGLVSNSVTVEQLSREGHMSPAEIKRLELELHTKGDHDSPYTFTLPTSMPQILAWTKLLARVHNGELKP
jgi:hypothetical protein